jgi:hypothetical protein
MTEQSGRRCKCFPNVYTIITCARVEFLTEVLLKIEVFWDVMLCRLLNSYRHFEGPQSLHLQDQVVREEWHYSD